MEEHRFSVLLVEDNTGDAHLIEMMLSEVRGLPIHLERVDRLAAAAERLSQGGIDAVLLDLGLPDSGGYDTIRRCHAHAPDVPIIVLTGNDDEVLGVNAVWSGAQDYLVKGQVDSKLLGRSIRYAIGRAKLQAEAREARGAAPTRDVSLLDDATGLLNLRTFSALAQQHLARAQRRRERRLLLLVCVDNLRDPDAGPLRIPPAEAIARATDVLRASLRGGDLLALIGRDELAALPLDPPDDQGEALIKAVGNRLARHNAQQPRRLRLVLSAGASVAESSAATTVEQLLAKARQALPVS